MGHGRRPKRTGGQCESISLDEAYIDDKRCLVDYPPEMMRKMKGPIEARRVTASTSQLDKPAARDQVVPSSCATHP